MTEMTDQASTTTAVVVRHRTRVLRQLADTARSAAGLIIAVADELADRAGEMVRAARR